MLRFRTIVLPIFHRVDPIYLEELALNAHAIVVRVPGLCQYDRVWRYYGKLSDQSDLLYERIARRWAIEAIPGAASRPCACAILSLRGRIGLTLDRKTGKPRRARERRKYRGPTTTWHCFERWRHVDLIVPKIRKKLLMLRSSGARLIIHAEDFSARWCAMADVRPAAWVLDNPVLTTEDVRDHAAAFNVPGWIRECHWAMRDRLKYFDAPTDLIRGTIVDERIPFGSIEQADTHGNWLPRDAKDKYAWSRSMVNSITDHVLRE